MEDIRFESSQKGAKALMEAHSISQSVLDELFGCVDEAAGQLVSEYSLEEEVDTPVVQEYLKIGFAENIALFLDEGVIDGEEDVRELIEDIDDDPLSNARTVSGRVASRHRDMMQLSGVILADNYGSNS